MIQKECYLDHTRILDSTVEKGTKQFPRQLGDIESVKMFINAVLEQNQAVSITVLHRLYGTGYGQENEKIYRNKLKKRIFDEYGDSLKFLKVDEKTPEVVVNSDGLNSTTIVKDRSMVLLKAAEYLRNDILEHITSCDTSNWPPTVENLSEFDENFPTSLSLFLTKILKSKDNPLSGSMKRYVHSFVSDLVNAVANGKIVTFKHFLLGLGLLV